MVKEMHIMVPKTVQYEQVGPRRYLILHESNYKSDMPAIRKQMIQDGYEYSNVESLGGGYFRYQYVKWNKLPPVEERTLFQLKAIGLPVHNVLLNE